MWIIKSLSPTKESHIQTYTDFTSIITHSVGGVDKYTDFISWRKVKFHKGGKKKGKKKLSFFTCTR